MEKTERNYPVIDGHRKHYVRYPVTNESGKWVAVDVLLPTGYRHLPLAVEFDSHEDCLKGCQSHNSYIGFSEEEADEIIGVSMAAANIE